MIVLKQYKCVELQSCEAIAEPYARVQFPFRVSARTDDEQRQAVAFYLANVPGCTAELHYDVRLDGLPDVSRYRWKARRGAVAATCCAVDDHILVTQHGEALLLV